MKRKIISLTKNYEKDEPTIYNSLLLRMANDDVSFDIESKIDAILKALEKKPKTVKDPHGLHANLIFFKYKFLASNKNRYKNLDQAHIYLKEAYKLGSPDAAAQYGYDYYTGTGITSSVDKEKANKYFNEAKKSSTYSCYLEFLIGEALHNEYKNKDTIDLDLLKKATSYYELALQKNVFEAKEKLISCYLDLEQNLDLAEKYLKDLDKYDSIMKNAIDQIRKKKKILK